MAAAISPGGASPAGGAGVDAGEVDGGGGAGEYGEMAGFLGAAGDSCRSSDLAAEKPLSPEKAAGMEHPAQSSRWTSGVDLDDETWDVRFSLDGQDILERWLCKSDITYLNLLALIEEKGYGISDSMYYVKEKGSGIAGMELLDGMRKVSKMVQLNEEKKCISLTVIRGQGSLPLHINRELEPCEDSEMLYLQTQQSNNMQNDRQEEEIEEEMEDNGSDSDGDTVQLSQRLVDMKKRKRSASHYGMDYEEEADELYAAVDISDDDSGCEEAAEVVEEPVPVKKKRPAMGIGPTSRTHCSQQSTTPADYVPSDDEGADVDLHPDDDDGFVSMSWALPKGRKSRAKKMEPRQWYDESRLQPEEGICLKMCFHDVYQFRRAVETLHIAQLRNYRLHRNCKDRVIVKCTEQGCPFFMVGSQIKGEKTFCLRKMHLDHTCGTSGEHCKITGKWVAKVCEPSMRIDPRTGIEAVMETTKEKFGVDVPKMMAYRAKKKALQVVLGDQVEQYRRIRDYLQTVLDTNPGSRCIVTTKTVAEHPSVNPRFHGMFYCLGACIEGFLKGCRPFIGLDGCFIKLTTGQQILSATAACGR